MSERNPYRPGQPIEGAETEEAPKSFKVEFAKFLFVVSLITSLAVGNLFYRQIPLIEMREYDFYSPFVFRMIPHEGEMTFKACFRKELFGGYYVCHKFPPSKVRYLKDGSYSPEQFSRLFIDQDYLGKFIAKFDERQVKIRRNFFGFRIDQTRRDLVVTPLYDQPKKRTSTLAVNTGKPFGRF